MQRAVSSAQDADIEYLEGYIGMKRAQAALRPLSLEIAKHVFPFGNRQPPKFDFSRQQPAAIFGIRRDRVQLYARLPKAQRRVIDPVKNFFGGTDTFAVRKLPGPARCRLCPMEGFSTSWLIIPPLLC